MIALGVDTSTPAGSVALAEGERLLGEINLARGGHHQERLLRSIDLLLDLAGLDVSRLAVLSVAVGPGTFTGLRIGIATVKGLALARGIPAFGLSTLAALALKYRDRGLPVAPLLDAGRGEVYAALYQGGPGGTRPIVAEKGGAPEEFISSLPPEPVLFCGDGALIYRHRILEIRGEKDLLEPAPTFVAGTLALWGAGELARGVPWSLGVLKPNYIRPPDAERGSGR